MIAKRVLVSGKVQGVGYRAFVVREVSKLSQLTGWVRNLADGRVEAFFQGPEGEITKIIEKCQIGPSTARVEQVTQHDEAVRDGSFGFNVRH